MSNTFHLTCHIVFITTIIKYRGSPKYPQNGNLGQTTQNMSKGMISSLNIKFNMYNILNIV